MISKAEIRSFKSAIEFWSGEGCYVRELSNSESDKELSIAYIRVVPGTQTQNHYLQKTDERYIIVKGTGIMVLGKKQIEVSEGDVVLIPAGHRQYIRNASHEDLVFYCICTPRYIQQNYVAQNE